MNCFRDLPEKMITANILYISDILHHIKKRVVFLYVIKRYLFGLNNILRCAVTLVYLIFSRKIMCKA